MTALWNTRYLDDWLQLLPFGNFSTTWALSQSLTITTSTVCLELTGGTVRFGGYAAPKLHFRTSNVTMQPRPVVLPPLDAHSSCICTSRKGDRLAWLSG